MFGSKKTDRKKEYEKDIHQNWHNQRKNGKKSFVIRFGILTWAGTSFMLYWVIVLLLGWITNNKQPYMMLQFFVTFILFILLGTLYGHLLWNRNEKIYLKKYPDKKKKG